jgi:hypothetical protein
MTVTAVTTSPAAQGSSPAAARSIYVEGNRTVGRFRVTVTGTYVNGGFAWNPQSLVGFDHPVAEVWFTPHVLVANVLLGARYLPAFDFVNKTIMLFDNVDGDEPSGDTLDGLAWDVVIVSE